VYKVSEQRKTDQVDVDKQVLAVVRQSKEKKFLFGYLGALFGLKTKEYPHKMAF
jgi:large subunit ribosomal protein L6e